MHDPFPSIWADVIARLPHPTPLVFHPEPNTDREHLSCCLCEHGADISRPPPEWLITFRTDKATVTRGLHEACRKVHTESRHARERP